MAQGLRSSEPVDQGIRRLASERLSSSLDRLDQRDAEVVHDVRKECKQVRALLRLVRGELGERVYHRENARLRDLARPLSELRDAQALVGALDGLLKHFARELRPRAFGHLRRALREVLHARQRTSELVQRRAARELSRGLKQIPEWPLEHHGWRALSPGLRATYARGRRAMHSAIESRTDEELHAWRKQAKYLRAELEVLRAMWPDALSGLADGLHSLSDLLGDDHDLAVLAASLPRHREALEDDERAALLGLLHRRRHELQSDAFLLGRMLYAEPPGLFLDSLHEHWRAWHQS